MKIIITDTKQEMGRRAAHAGAALVRRALAQQGRAAIIVATGTSQFELFEHLTRAPDLDWSRVTAFHLDEYIGLPAHHPASFRRYLKERFADRLPRPLQAFHSIQAEQDPGAECERLNGLISQAEVDVAFVGIGENGHLAFNDPPADFEVEAPYITVRLDEACRRQQLGEGWFESLDDVPREAITMSIRQIMKSRAVVCTVPDARKAAAVQQALEGPVTPDVPASILQRHPRCHVFLDPASASRLAHHRPDSRTG